MTLGLFHVFDLVLHCKGWCILNDISKELASQLIGHDCCRTESVSTELFLKLLRLPDMTEAVWLARWSISKNAHCEIQANCTLNKNHIETLALIECGIAETPSLDELASFPAKATGLQALWDWNEAKRRYFTRTEGDDSDVLLPLSPLLRVLTSDKDVPAVFLGGVGLETFSKPTTRTLMQNSCLADVGKLTEFAESRFDASNEHTEIRRRGSIWLGLKDLGALMPHLKTVEEQRLLAKTAVIATRGCRLITKKWKGKREGILVMRAAMRPVLFARNLAGTDPSNKESKDLNASVAVQLGNIVQQNGAIVTTQQSYNCWIAENDAGTWWRKKPGWDNQSCTLGNFRTGEPGVVYAMGAATQHRLELNDVLHDFRQRYKPGSELHISNKRKLKRRKIE